jgi:hypothetical protein
MAEYKPVNALEELLVRAATDPAARPDFYRELLRSTLYAVTPETPATSTTTVAAAGTTLSLVNWKGSSGPFVPVFSSQERLEEVAHKMGRRVGFVALPGKTLFEMLMQHPEEAILNPGLSYGKQFTPDEIRRVADGTLLRAQVHTIKEDTQVLLGQPADYPQRLVDALVRLFKERPSVEAAYLAQVHFAGEPAPHPLVGLLSSDYGKDGSDAGLVATEVGDASTVTFVDMATAKRDDPLSRYLREKTKPFFVRAKTKPFWKVW